MLRLEYHRLRLNRQKKEKGEGRRRRRRRRRRGGKRDRVRADTEEKERKARKKREETKESGKRRGSGARSRNFGANREGEDPPWSSLNGEKRWTNSVALDFGWRSRAPATMPAPAKQGEETHAEEKI